MCKFFEYLKYLVIIKEMKVVLLLVMILYAGVVYATERPVWEDNCPQGLQDAVYKDVQWYWPEGTRASQELYNYWAQRRVEFYDALAKCDFMADLFKDACYESVRSKQAVDNELYRQKIENKKIISQVWRDTNKMTNSVMFNILSR